MSQPVPAPPSPLPSTRDGAGSALHPDPRPVRRPLVRLLALAAAVVGVTVLAAAVRSAVGDGAVASLLTGAAAAAAGLLVYARVVRRLEHRPVHELSRSCARAHLAQGVLAGTALFAVTLGAIAALGGYEVTGYGSAGGALAVLGLMVGVAVTEELLFRGVLLRVVEEMTGTWGALGLSAALFGALHLVNEGATVWGALAVATEAGLMLGAAYVATRTLWLPIGLHLGWNVAEAGVFSTAVSGSEATTGLLEGTMDGSVLLTGGTFGPEASVVSVVACLAVTAVLLRQAQRRGRIVPGRRARALGAAA